MEIACQAEPLLQQLSLREVLPEMEIIQPARDVAYHHFANGKIIRGHVAHVQEEQASLHVLSAEHERQHRVHGEPGAEQRVHRRAVPTPCPGRRRAKDDTVRVPDVLAEKAVPAQIGSDERRHAFRGLARAPALPRPPLDQVEPWLLSVFPDQDRSLRTHDADGPLEPGQGRRAGTAGEHRKTDRRPGTHDCALDVDLGEAPSQRDRQACEAGVGDEKVGPPPDDEHRDAGTRLESLDKVIVERMLITINGLNTCCSVHVTDSRNALGLIRRDIVYKQHEG